MSCLLADHRGYAAFLPTPHQAPPAPRQQRLVLIGRKRWCITSTEENWPNMRGGETMDEVLVIVYGIFSSVRQRALGFLFST